LLAFWPNPDSGRLPLDSGCGDVNFASFSASSMAISVATDWWQKRIVFSLPCMPESDHRFISNLCFGGFPINLSLIALA